MEEGVVEEGVFHRYLCVWGGEVVRDGAGVVGVLWWWGGSVCVVHGGGVLGFWGFGGGVRDGVLGCGQNVMVMVGDATCYDYRCGNTTQGTGGG